MCKLTVTNYLLDNTEILILLLVVVFFMGVAVGNFFVNDGQEEDNHG